MPGQFMQPIHMGQPPMPGQPQVSGLMPGQPFQINQSPAWGYPNLPTQLVQHPQPPHYQHFNTAMPPNPQMQQAPVAPYPYLNNAMPTQMHPATSQIQPQMQQMVQQGISSVPDQQHHVPKPSTAKRPTKKRSSPNGPHENKSRKRSSSAGSSVKRARKEPYVDGKGGTKKSKTGMASTGKSKRADDESDEDSVAEEDSRARHKGKIASGVSEKDFDIEAKNTGANEKELSQTYEVCD